MASLDRRGLNRRDLLALAGSAALAGTLPNLAGAAEARKFAPQPGDWRTFEVTTMVEIASPNGATRAWLPMPSINTDYQQSIDNHWSGNATNTRVASDSHYGAKMLCAEFDSSAAKPTVTLTSVVRTRSRAVDWQKRIAATDDAD